MIPVVLITIRKMLYSIRLGIIIVIYCPFVNGRGIMLLHRPKDATHDCAFSSHLRYDLSYGNGLSDTITVNLRTIEDIDYECQIDIATDAINKMIVVIRFPTNIKHNCEHNPQAFNVLKRDDVFPICGEDHLYYQDISSNYWLLYTQGRFRFKFRSNSSINSDMGAYSYSVTATTARQRKHEEKCNRLNETDCFAERLEEYYCITSGVMCDGITNCGSDNWFDERKIECEMPIQRLGYPPILALMALLACATLAGVHTLRRCLVISTSFFIYDTNEVNKFRIDPIFRPPSVSYNFEPNEEIKRKKSLVPMGHFSSSDDDSEEEDKQILSDLKKNDESSVTLKDPKKELIKMAKLPTKTIKSVSSRIQHHLRSMTDTRRGIEDEPSPSPDNL